MQTLPSSSCLSSLPWDVLLIDMNLKNFPKSLDSKTSCLRITIPENLDLALEGLIRKVLREQPKMDDIYAFAADYFDMLLKIRDKVGKKFAADQLCPFHNDEDAHDMIKLASVFAKSGTPRTKMPEIQKTKNSDNKLRRKEASKSTVKPGKAVQNVKQLVEIEKKPEQLAGEKKDGKLLETETEGKKQIKLEPQTEDVGDDEEFLKSDSIKLLVEKELMDAAKPWPEDKEKENKNDTSAQQNGKLEELTKNEELCSVIDKDSKKPEVKRTSEIVSKEKEKKTEDAAKDKKEEENKAVEKTEIEIYNIKTDKSQEEGITEALNSPNGAAAEEIKKELRDDAKNKYEEAKTEIQDESLEIKSENEHVKSVESLAAEGKTQIPVEGETKAEEKIKDITRAAINQEAPKETPEAQNAMKGKSFEEIMELDPEKDERAVLEETQDAVKDKITEEPPLAEEVNFNPDEICTVVDILSIKPREKDESNVEQVKEGRAGEQTFKKEEGISEAKMKTEEVLTKEDKEGVQTQQSAEALEKTTESTFANKAEDPDFAISPNKKEVEEEYEKFIPEKVKIIEEGSDTADSVEKLKVQISSEDNKSEIEKTMKEKEVESIDSEETKLVQYENQKSTEDNLQGMQNNETSKISTSKIIGDDLAQEENRIKEMPKTTVENERGKSVEEEFRFKESPMEVSENGEPLIMIEEAETAKGSEIKPENEGIKFAECSEVKEEALQQVKTEIEAEKLIQNYEKPEDINLEEVNSVTSDQKPSEEPSIIQEERTNLTEFTRQSEVECESQKEELKPKEEIESLKEVEDKVQVVEENIYAKPKKTDNVTEFLEETDIVENAEHAVEALPKDSEKEKLLIMQNGTKALGKSEKAETLKFDAVESTDPLANEDEVSTLKDSQHVIKIEEAEKLPEEIPYTERVQIKTIQTHYYDTLQVPAQSTKEYRVHPVKNHNVADNLLNITNVVLSSNKEQVTEIAALPFDLPQQDDDELYKRDLEDSLMTPSSSSSLNVSELSVQTVSEMFLNSEKQYSSMDIEERKYLTDTREKCGDEGHMEKLEVEEIIRKTIVPPPVKATPVAPRDDSDMNEEANVKTSLKDEKKQEPSVDSEDRTNSSNGSRSVDSDTPIISLEVKTVIETQNLEDEEQEKDGSGPEAGSGSDVQIRIEATIDVPEGMFVDMREEKDFTEEVRQHASNEASTSETVPKESQTSSGESESTVSSTATEIKRNDSTKRHFSSTRTLIATQSLDLDKRNPLLKTRSLSSFRQGVVDFEVWNAIEKELEEAATKIQSNFRGYKTRKKLQRENAVHITTEESSCSTTPAEPESREERQQSTGEFHDSIVLTEHPR